MWKQCSQGLSGDDCTAGSASTMDWSYALQAAESEEFAGYGDWRLLNIGTELAGGRTLLRTGDKHDIFPEYRQLGLLVFVTVC